MKKKIMIMVTTLLVFVFALPVFAKSDCSHLWETIYRIDPYCTISGVEYRYCTLCYKSETITLPPAGHIWGEWETLSESDCSHLGTKSRACTICHLVEHASIPTNDIHSWSSWISSTGLCTEERERYRYCSYCGKREYNNIPATNHIWGYWHTDKKASIFQSGSKVRYCCNCPAENRKNIPKIKMTASQKKIKKSVDVFFKYAKKYNASKIRSCFAAPAKTNLFIQNKYMPKFFQKYNKYISYEIHSIRVKRATATVKLSYQYLDYQELFTDAIDAYVEHFRNVTSHNEDQAQRYLYTYVMRNAKYYGKNYCGFGEKTIKLRKIKGKWKISSFNSQLENMLHCNYAYAYNAYPWGD